MAGAMARGWAGADNRPEAMLFCDLDSARASALAEEVGGETVDSLAALAGASDLIVLAVKPAALDDVAAELRGRARIVVSLLAGVPTKALTDAFPGHARAATDAQPARRGAARRHLPPACGRHARGDGRAGPRPAGRAR